MLVFLVTVVVEPGTVSEGNLRLLSHTGRYYLSFYTCPE